MSKRGLKDVYEVHGFKLRHSCITHLAVDHQK